MKVEKWCDGIQSSNPRLLSECGGNVLHNPHFFVVDLLSKGENKMSARIRTRPQQFGAMYQAAMEFGYCNEYVASPKQVADLVMDMKDLLDRFNSISDSISTFLNLAKEFNKE